MIIRPQITAMAQTALRPYYINYTQTPLN